jgi:hypothetical protein
MDVVRRISLLVTTGLLGIAVLLGWVDERPAMSATAAVQLQRSTAYFDSTITLARFAKPRGERGDRLAIALGYLERLRLGLADPFRLADQALDDPRLDSRMQSRVAWALLGRLRRGDAYVIDPAVLDGSGPWSLDGHGATGAAHVALIERAVSSASDPRAGELAVRLAYQIEAGKGAIAGSSVSVASEVAALVRDRALATADLADLFESANTEHQDVMAALETRRATRGFAVERPALAPLDSRLQIEAMDAVPALLRALDTLDRVSIHAHDDASIPVIGRRFAERLAAHGDSQPPQSQVVVTLGAHQGTGAALRASNDETLAAAYAPMAALPDSSRRAPALTLLSAAVALRTAAQEQPWFPGDPAPTVSDVAAEFGVRGVAFARDVPDEWRPYYLRQLRDALRDLQIALPAVRFDDLLIRFGASTLPDSALAMHDPRTRTLELSINTSGGTLAHELAHDLDWQTARRLFANAGGYSTDRAMREQRGPLAVSVRGLAEAKLLRPVAGVASPPVADRPAELFARGVDWFVASSLALGGRSNGFLTAVEDATLSGYAAGAPAAVGASGVRSLITALEQMTYLPDSSRAAFASLWSDPDVVDPVVMVRRVMQSPVPWRIAWSSRSPLAALPAPAVCAGSNSPEADARERLLMIALDARARGIALHRARFRRSGAPAGWANGLLGAAPWSPDDGERVVAALRSALAGQVAGALGDQGVVPSLPAIFRSSAASCSTISR